MIVVEKDIFYVCLIFLSFKSLNCAQNEYKHVLYLKLMALEHEGELMNKLLNNIGAGYLAMGDLNESM